MDFDGGHFAVLVAQAGPRGARTAAILQEPFALGLGGRAVFGDGAFGREDLPLAHPVRLGDLVEGFPRAHGDPDHPPAPLHALASRMVEVEAGGLLLRGLFPQEALGFQDVLERLLELLTRARIDDGVDAAV